jgi:ubiquitin fusion degradation protein 1
VGIPGMAKPAARRNGPQPLRLEPNKLFFGYEVKPKPAKKDEAQEEQQKKQHFFSGEGQTLRKKK